MGWKHYQTVDLPKREPQVGRGLFGTPGGGVLPIMAYMGRLRPKGVPFSGFRYIKG